MALHPPGIFAVGGIGREVPLLGPRSPVIDTGDDGEKDATGISYYQIGMATSDDGVAWQRANDGKPVLTKGAAGAFDAVQAATPSVLRDGDGYRMWYAAWAPQSNHTICVARSADGMTWQRENDGQPVEGLDPSIAYGHSVCRVGDEWFLVVHHFPKKRCKRFVITSSEGLNSRDPNKRAAIKQQIDRDVRL